MGRGGGGTDGKGVRFEKKKNSEKKRDFVYTISCALGIYERK